MEELVSVVIPTYNRANIVTRAIDSVRNQTYKNIEIIVVDDASSDNTEKVVRNIADERILYIKHDTNRGGGAARNTGIEIAKGGFIAFLDDDDIWLENKLEKQLSFLRKGTFNAVCCALKFVGTGSKNGEVLSFRNSQVKPRDLIHSNCLGSTSVLIAESSIFKHFKFDDRLKQSQDWDLYLNILENGFKIGYVNEPLVLISDDFDRFRITTGIQNRPLEELDDFTFIFEKHKVFFGWWFYNYNKASKYLAYLLLCRRKRELVIFAIKKTNFLVVLAVFVDKILRKIKRIFKINKLISKINESFNN